MDLMSLAISMGLQGEMKEVRAEAGEAFNGNAVESTEQTTMSQAAEVVESAIAGFESSVSSVASAMIPTGAMVEAVMPSSAALELDLTMPTASPKAC